VLASEEAILQRFAFLLGPAIESVRMRIHGDLHLGQVLRTEGDFCIIDFEGEPARPLSERRLKRSPMRDVAGMLRSFNYASQAALREEVERGVVLPSDLPKIEPWADYWCSWASTAFLNGYLTAAGQARFVPRHRGDLRRLLGAALLDKAMYELTYEMNNRPAWVGVPLRGILHLLGENDGD
jgi:maltose alpha-D-glucosyltransferase/alpha-amylase